MSEPLNVQVVSVPMGDTGLGREAGFKDDAELIAAAEKQREELRATLTPEAFQRLEDAELEAERRFLFGA